VCPRDAFRNLRDDDAFYLSSQLFSANLTLQNDQHHTGVGAEYIRPDMQYNADTHCFDFSYTPQRAGNYRLDITYEQQRLTTPEHVQGSPFFLYVQPDKVSGPKSLVQQLAAPLVAEAGSCYNFTIVARDNAENFIFDGEAQFQVHFQKKSVVHLFFILLHCVL
jgi:hypothetical protein